MWLLPIFFRNEYNFFISFLKQLILHNVTNKLNHLTLDFSLYLCYAIKVPILFVLNVKWWIMNVNECIYLADLGDPETLKRN